MSSSEKPKADRASTWTDRLLAPGDGLRQWWDGLPRVQKWVFGVLLFGAVALLPLYTPPFLNTPGISFGGTMAQFAMVAIIAIGLNVVVGQAGLLDLGYVGFYAVGAYTVALLTSPDSPWNKVGPNGFFSTPWAWLSCVPLAMAFTALAGLILGIPTLRLRGDYLAIVTLGFGEIIRLMADNLADITNGPRGLNEVAFPRVGESEKLPEGVFSSAQLDGSRELRHLVVLARPDPHRDHPAARRQPGAQPGRPRVDLHPGGRGRRGSDGRQHLPVQAVGVRDRRGDRRPVRCAVRGQVQYVAPPTFNIINSMLFLCAVVLGGQGNKLGVIFGAFIIVYLPNRLLGVEFLGINLGDLKYLFFGLALVVLMIFRPQGLFPARQQLLTYGRAARDLLRAAPGEKEPAA